MATGYTQPTHGLTNWDCRLYGFDYELGDFTFSATLEVKPDGEARELVRCEDWGRSHTVHSGTFRADFLANPASCHSYVKVMCVSVAKGWMIKHYGPEAL